MDKTDRRIRRTQKLLGDALIQLALERGYENITIQDVTAHADVGYRTFFRHFNSLDDLLRAVAQAHLDELERIFRFPPADTLTKSLRDHAVENGCALFEYIQDNEVIFRVLLLQDAVRFCLQPVIQHAREYVEAFFGRLPPAAIEPPILANHVVYATFALLRWWLENDKPYPVERMGEIFATLILLPTLN